MYKVYLTTDPMTGRALFKDEEEFLGAFESLFAVSKAIGDAILRFCSIRTK